MVELLWGNRQILPQQYFNRFEDFQAKEEITSLPEYIKMCKYFIKRRISIIIIWSYAKLDSDRLKYLSREIKVKGWTPKPTSKTLIKEAPRVASLSAYPSKAALNEKLKKALQDMETQ